MTYSPYNTTTERRAHEVAINLIETKRTQRISQFGFSCSRDDSLSSESLAIASAFYLLPAWMNPDIAHIEETSILVSPLHEFIRERAFDIEVERDDFASDMEKPMGVSYRIDLLAEGLALGLAELERLLRIQAADDRDPLQDVPVHDTVDPGLERR